MIASKITNNQFGFTLVQAVFILAVLGVLGMVMMRMSGVQTATGVMALQQARAYHAARSGLEWGAARILNDEDADCAAIKGEEVVAEGFEEFYIEIVSCEETVGINEGAGSYNIYNIESQAKTLGDYGSPYYVSRKLQMKVGSYDVE